MARRVDDTGNRNRNRGRDRNRHGNRHENRHGNWSGDRGENRCESKNKEQLNSCEPICWSSSSALGRSVVFP